MKTRILALAIVFALLATGIYAYLRFLRPENVPPAPSPATETQNPAASEQDAKLQASYMYIATESGQLALDLLESQAQVETQDYGDAGQFVTAINGLVANNEYYWAFYVNNEYAQRGASQTVLQEGDVVRFVYEPVQVMRVQIDAEGNVLDSASGTILEGAEDASSAGSAQ